MIRCTVYGNGGGKDPPSDEALCNAEKKAKQCITKKIIKAIRINGKKGEMRCGRLVSFSYLSFESVCVWSCHSEWARLQGPRGPLLEALLRPPEPNSRAHCLYWLGAYLPRPLHPRGAVDLPTHCCLSLGSPPKEYWYLQVGQQLGFPPSNILHRASWRDTCVCMNCLQRGCTTLERQTSLFLNLTCTG